MIKKYLTGGWRHDLIGVVEIERETESSVWIDGRRSAKISRYEVYHDSWDQAKEYLMIKAERGLDSARRRLETAQGHYGNVKGLKVTSE